MQAFHVNESRTVRHVNASGIEAAIAHHLQSLFKLLLLRLRARRVDDLRFCVMREDTFEFYMLELPEMLNQSGQLFNAGAKPPHASVDLQVNSNARSLLLWYRLECLSSTSVHCRGLQRIQ